MPSVIGRQSPVFVIGFESCSVGIVFQQVDLKVGLKSLPNLLLRELEDFADFTRILFLKCFLSVHLPSEPRFQVGANETSLKR